MPVVGHANPSVVEAVQQRVTQGTHFAQPVEDAMDAIHLMRAITGRDLVVKIEGSHHGHHDLVNVSIWRSLDDLGPADDPSREPGAGVATACAELVRILPFNDLEAAERLFAAEGDDIAGLIIEPMMMNAGIIPPLPGYLEGLRDLTRRNGSLLVFDEAKTGLVIAWGGATELFGVTPDIVCLAKALGGGVPCGAIGGTEEVMSAIKNGRYDQVGTFNGNPLTMAAARAVLTEVLVPEAYTEAEAIGRAMLSGCEEALAEQGLASYGTVHGFKGSVVVHDQRPTNYREFLEVDTAICHLNYLMQHNRGVFTAPWGKSESWTLSVAHTRADGDRVVENTAELAKVIAATDGSASEIFSVGGLTS